MEIVACRMSESLNEDKGHSASKRPASVTDDDDDDDDDDDIKNNCNDDSLFVHNDKLMMMMMQPNSVTFRAGVKSQVTCRERGAMLNNSYETTSFKKKNNSV
ncbi:hypothetical protein PoB_001349500 [Plakobranchus ocellatus]|uniref:Uncharacterized protein n=1 Tax=Plakobranchus ocellatus TaxID=259542 RepID=A0AAV3YUY7_9GAST|nr:hypothetical protein PoB_001349500 [Plakobranchus ocellatus]